MNHDDQSSGNMIGLSIIAIVSLMIVTGTILLTISYFIHEASHGIN